MEYQKIEIDSVNLKSPSAEKLPTSWCRIVGLETTNADELSAAGQYLEGCVVMNYWYLGSKLHWLVGLYSDTANAQQHVGWWVAQWRFGNCTKSFSVSQFLGLPLFKSTLHIRDGFESLDQVLVFWVLSFHFGDHMRIVKWLFPTD